MFAAMDSLQFSPHMPVEVFACTVGQKPSKVCRRGAHVEMVLLCYCRPRLIGRECLPAGPKAFAAKPYKQGRAEGFPTNMRTAPCLGRSPHHPLTLVAPTQPVAVWCRRRFM